MTRTIEKLSAFLMVWMLLAGSLLAIGLPTVTLATSDEQPTETNNEDDTSSGDEGGTEETPTEPETPPEDTQPPIESEPPPAEAGPIEEVAPPPQPVEPEAPIVQPEDELPLEENATTPSPIPSLSPELPDECAPNATPLECLEDLTGEEAPKCPEGMTPLECLDYLVNIPIEDEPTCPPGQFPTTPGDASSCVDCEGECPPEEPVPPTLPPCYPEDQAAEATATYTPICEAPPEKPGDNYDPRLTNEDDLNCSDIDGSVKVIGKDVYGLDRDKDGVGCEANGNDGDDQDNDEHKKTVIIKKIIKQTNSDGNNGHHHESFPEIDIIGISAKENGDAEVCLINIDDENIQCQDFGMPNDRVSGDFWRIIETDHDKDYDNGNTGSDDIDDVIDDIKSQDFSALDDASNHDFDIDLAWIAISPDGEGVVCLTEDSSGKGKALCEPFKVSSQEISGQITEGVQFT